MKIISGEGLVVNTPPSFKRLRFPAENTSHAAWLYHRFPLSFHRRPQAGGKWHLDRVFIKVNGVRQYLWDAEAAKRFLAELMKKQRRVPECR